MKAPLIPILALGLLASSTPAQDQPDLTKPNQKYNYALGQDIVSTFKQMEVDIDLKAFVAGMQDALAGKPALTPGQQKAAMAELSKTLTAKAEEKQKVAAVQNLKDGQAFLAANAKKEGVKVKAVIAPDGSKAELQYKILKTGAGPSPRKIDSVEVHYTGLLIDGTVFDSSVKRGVPATFGVTDVIPGWIEALQMMKVGDKWQLFVPPNLAYGEFAPGQIGPNSVLVFEVELLAIYPPKEAGSASATNTQPATAK